MGKFLHRLGHYAFTHAWYVIAVWILTLVILGFSAAHFIKPTSSAISIPGTEAQQALDRMSELFPTVGKGSARIILAAPEGKIIPDYQSIIKNTAVDIKKVVGVQDAIDPFTNPSALSKDKSIAYIQVQLKDGSGSITKETIDGIEEVVENTRTSGLQVEMGGDVIRKSPGEILGPGEIGGLVVALLVLIATLGSLIAAGMPIITALVGVGVSMAGLFSLSQVITISSTTPVLAVMLGLAVGIDYSLFIINRYRTYVIEGYSYEAAAARSIQTAGNAVVFAAATVVIALASLTVVQIPFMTTMGLTAAAAIAIAAAVAITLVPALLKIAGSKIFRKSKRVAIAKAQKRGPHEDHHANRNTFWYKWGVTITKYPIVVVAACILVIAIIALPVLKLQLGLPTDEYASKTTTERRGYDLLTKGFGAGFNGPLLVVVEGLPPVSEVDKALVRNPAIKQLDDQIAAATAQQQAVFQQKAAQVQTVEQAAALQQEVAAVQASGAQRKTAAIESIEQNVEKYARLMQLKKVADRIATNYQVASSTPALATDDGTKGLIQVIPTTGPSDKATIDLINNIRDTNHRQELTGSDAISLAVTGSTALQNDINTKLSAALPVYLLVVVGLSFILLIIAFRSILVPLKATLGFLLSVLAMFGAVVAVFQWGWFGISDAPGPIISFIPIISIGILFGLAMDYEFFLVSSMHEAYHETNDAHRSVLRGFAHASKVVTAAACIMVAVFAGFIFNEDITIKSIGFGLAFGILVDAFIVRLTLVPAVMVLLGKSAWWLPKWLDRIVPHISIEGEDKK